MTMTRRRLLDDSFKKTVEGNPAIATDSLARMYPGIEMQGWTEQKSTTGAQLFDEKFAPTYTTNGITVEWLESEKCFLFNGTSTAVIDTESYINLPATKGNNYTAQTVYISGSVTAPEGKVSGAYFGASDEENTKNNWLFASFVNQLNSRTAICNYDYITAFWFYIDANITFNNYKVRVMLNEGSTALPYEPYTGGAPSPSPDYPQEIVSAGNWNEETQKWEYEMEVGGTNLFDEKSVKETTSSGITIEWLEDEGCFLLNGTCTHTMAFTLTDINLKGNIGSNYTVSVHKISGEVSVPDGGACVAYFGVSDSPASGGHPRENWLESSIENEVPNTGVLNRKYINTFWFYIAEGVSLVNCKLNVMLEQGNTVTEYEPYKLPQTVLLTADRPLTKWDKLTKKNGVWGWAYSSGIYTVTGEEIFYSSNATYKGEETSDAWFDNNEMVQIPSPNTQIGYCEQLSFGVSIWSEVNDGKIGFAFNRHQIHMRLRNSDTGINAEDTLTDVSSKIKAYAAQKYQEGNPFIFLYETKEPVFVPLSTSEQEQMNELHTNRPTTALSNDAGCEMVLTYKTKKSLEVTT